MNENIEGALCEVVEETGAARLLAAIREEPDVKRRADLLEHVLFCPNCSRVHRQSLALLKDSVIDRTSTFRSVLQPFCDWLRSPNAELVEVYRPTEVTAPAAQQWTLRVGEDDELSPAEIRLILFQCDDGSQRVFVKSDNAVAAYSVRGLLGSKVLFELELNPGEGRAATLAGEFDPQCAIEIYQID